MQKALPKKKKKMFDVEPASASIKETDMPKRVSVSKAENGFVIDFNYGQKTKIATSASDVAEAIEEYFA